MTNRAGPTCLRASIMVVTAILLPSAATSAFAEGRCPPGMFKTGSGDFIGCAPNPGYGEGQAAEEDQRQIEMVWADRWGAYASEKGASGLGVVNGRAWKAAAEKGAVLVRRHGPKER